MYFITVKCQGLDYKPTILLSNSLLEQKTSKENARPPWSASFPLRTHTA